MSAAGDVRQIHLLVSPKLYEKLDEGFGLFVPCEGSHLQDLVNLANAVIKEAPRRHPLRWVDLCGDSFKVALATVNHGVLHINLPRRVRRQKIFDNELGSPHGLFSGSLSVLAFVLRHRVEEVDVFSCVLRPHKVVKSALSERVLEDVLETARLPKDAHHEFSSEPGDGAPYTLKMSLGDFEKHTPRDSHNRGSAWRVGEDRNFSKVAPRAKNAEVNRFGVNSFLLLGVGRLRSMEIVGKH